jgi:hypothetical protein
MPETPQRPTQKFSWTPKFSSLKFPLVVFLLSRLCLGQLTDLPVAGPFCVNGNVGSGEDLALGSAAKRVAASVKFNANNVILIFIIDTC